MDCDIEIIRSDRKTISIEINRENRVIVRAPKRIADESIQKFIKDKSAWIEKHIEIMKKRCQEEKKILSEPKFSQEQICALTKKAKEVIPKLVSHYAPIVGAEYNKITIRHQVSRWASRSSNGNLSFNCLLVLCPPEVLSYVVVHELCHFKQMNHSPKFWAEVARVMPDYKLQSKWLKENGALLIRRLR